MNDEKCPYCLTQKPQGKKGRIKAHLGQYVRWIQCPTTGCHFKFKEELRNEDILIIRKGKENR